MVSYVVLDVGFRISGEKFYKTLLRDCDDRIFHIRCSWLITPFELFKRNPLSVWLYFLNLSLSKASSVTYDSLWHQSCGYVQMKKKTRSTSTVLNNWEFFPRHIPVTLKYKGIWGLCKYYCTFGRCFIRQVLIYFFLLERSSLSWQTWHTTSSFSPSYFFFAVSVILNLSLLIFQRAPMTLRGSYTGKWNHIQNAQRKPNWQRCCCNTTITSLSSDGGFVFLFSLFKMWLEHWQVCPTGRGYTNTQLWNSLFNECYQLDQYELQPTATHYQSLFPLTLFTSSLSVIPLFNCLFTDSLCVPDTTPSCYRIEPGTIAGIICADVLLTLIIVVVTYKCASFRRQKLDNGKMMGLSWTMFFMLLWKVKVSKCISVDKILSGFPAWSHNGAHAMFYHYAQLVFLSFHYITLIDCIHMYI